MSLPRRGSLTGKHAKSSGDYQVGQVLYYLPREVNPGGRNNDGPCEVTILAVGRKWLQTSRFGKVDIDTLAVDAGVMTSPGRCYRTEQARNEAIEVDRLWRWLNRCMPGRPPASCDSHALRRIMGILGVDPPPPADTPKGVDEQ